MQCKYNRPFMRLPVLDPVYCPETRPHLAVGLAEFLVVHEISMVVGSCVTARCPCVDSANKLSTIKLHSMQFKRT